MARVLNEEFTVPGDATGETPAYSTWADVSSAATINADVVISNNYGADLWLQFADDQNNPAEPVDVFAIGPGPNNKYRVFVQNLPPEGAYVRVKGIVWEDNHEAPCHATIDTNN